MTQNWDDAAQRPDLAGGRPGKNSLPILGVLLAGTIALGGLGGWFFSSPSTPDAPAVETLSPEQLSEAIPTLNSGAQQAARSDPRECRIGVGYITVATPGNPAGGTVSFRTSKYQSPVFHVTDKPQRIAIPNPLPDSGGIDLFSADGDANGLVASLTPPARMEPVNGSTTIRVIWRPRPRCKP